MNNSHFQACLETEVLGYLEHGFSVFPLPYGKKAGRLSWKRFQEERASESDVRTMFSKPKNVAIVAGEVSKLVVRDFDDPEKYRQWKANHSALAAKAPTVATASGFHVYVTMNPIPRLRVTGVGSGELRGTGAYVVAPPSLHPSGTQYKWINPLRNPLPLVTFSDLDLEHLSSNLTEEHRSRQKSTEEHRLQKPYGSFRKRETKNFVDIFLGAISQSIPTEEGHRDRKLFELARRLLQFGELEIDVQLSIFDEWWKLSKDIVGTKSYEVSMNAFLRCMTRATTPLDDIIGGCLDRAKAKPFPAWSMRFNGECQLLAGLCYELQLLNGKEPFFLSCRAAGDAIGKSYTIANQYLQLFVRIKKLQVAELGSVGGHRATRYRYLG